MRTALSVLVAWVGLSFPASVLIGRFLSHCDSGANLGASTRPQEHAP